MDERHDASLYWRFRSEEFKPRIKLVANLISEVR